VMRALLLLGVGLVHDAGDPTAAPGG